MSHPTTDPKPLDLVARAIHKRARKRTQGAPAWEDLNISDTWHAGLIRLAFERAREFITMSGGDEE